MCNIHISMTTATAMPMDDIASLFCTTSSDQKWPAVRSQQDDGELVEFLEALPLASPTNGKSQKEESSRKNRRCAFKKKLPRYVVSCSSTKRQECFGAKLKISKRSIRIGSNYVDVQSASNVAEAAKMYLKLDESTELFYTHVPCREAVLETCNVYVGMNRVTRSVLDVLNDFVKVKNAKCVWKFGQKTKKKRKGTWKTPAGSKRTRASSNEEREEVVSTKPIPSRSQIPKRVRDVARAYEEDLSDIDRLLMRTQRMCSDIMENQTFSSSEERNIKICWSKLLELRRTVHDSRARLEDAVGASCLK